MRVYIFLSFSFILITITSYGQSKSQRFFNEWHNGALVLNSNEVVRGKIKYSHVYDAVLMHSEGKVSAYSAFQVNYFYYNNSSTGVMYQYSALPYFSPDKNYQRSYFFEILLQGDILYLRKANKKARLIDSEHRKMANSRLNKERACYDYYMLYDDKVTCINDFMESALPLLAKEYPKRISEFIRKKNIRDFTPHEKLVILHYYNTMQEETLQLEAAIPHKFEGSAVKADPVVRAGHYAE